MLLHKLAKNNNINLSTNMTNNNITENRSRRAVGEQLTWRFIRRKEAMSESVSLPASSSSLQNNGFLLMVPNSLLLLNALLQLETKVLRAVQSQVSSSPETTSWAHCPAQKLFPSHLRKHFYCKSLCPALSNHIMKFKGFKCCV